MVGRALATCFLLFTVYGAIIPDQGEPLKRTARCDVCDQAHHSLSHHPVFQTHQWSGLARSSDGTQQGVFSGAAAAANGGSQASEEAFSLAASSVNSGGNYHGSNKGFNGYSSYHKYSGDKNAGQNFGGNLQQTQFHGFDQGQQVQSKDFGSAASSQSQNTIGKSWDETKYGSNHVGRDISLVGDNGRGDLDRPHNDGSYAQSHAQNSQIGSFDARQQQSYHSSSGINTGQRQAYHSGSNRGALSNGFQSSHQHAVDTGFEGNTQQVQKANYDGGKWEKYNYGGNNGHIAESQSKSSFGIGVGSVRDEGQATLHGALDLASQGLQSAQQIQPQPGCSTCSKGNYALSNAKSKSGNAVAVSIGG